MLKPHADTPFPLPLFGSESPLLLIHLDVAQAQASRTSASPLQSSTCTWSHGDAHLKGLFSTASQLERSLRASPWPRHRSQHRPPPGNAARKLPFHKRGWSTSSGYEELNDSPPSSALSCPTQKQQCANKNKDEVDTTPRPATIHSTSRSLGKGLEDRHPSLFFLLVDCDTT